MAKQEYFNQFLSNIEPSKTTVEYISSIQNSLRNYLWNDDTYSNVIVDDFLSGSYAKHTSIRPVKDDKNRDVDIIIVTNHTDKDNSIEVLQELFDVLKKNDKYSSAKIQHHSVSIKMGQVDIDVVPAVKDDANEDLYKITDSKTGLWIRTDPKGHISWSTTVNDENSNEFKPLVKIFKWWRHTNCPENIRYPKGITLEKIVSDNLGDSTLSTEDFLMQTMQNILDAYKENYCDLGMMPTINDPSNELKSNNLLEGYKFEDFKKFIDNIKDNIELLNTDGTANSTWIKILGTEFPNDSETKSTTNFMLCTTASHRLKPQWPMSRGGYVLVLLKVTNQKGERIEYESNGQPLPKDLNLEFRALTGVKMPYSVKWQITNTGTEARLANCLRGDFYNSNEGNNVRTETTKYSGSHSVQCFIIKHGVCIAKSTDYIINII